MGIKGSKFCANVGSEGGSCSASSSSSRGNERKSKRKNGGSRAFQSSCLGSSSSSPPRFLHDTYSGGNNVDVGKGSCTESDVSGSNQVKIACSRKNKHEQSGEAPCVSSNIQHAPISCNNFDQATSSHSFTSSSRFLSRFSFVPGSVSFRFGRTSSNNVNHSASLRVYAEHDEFISNEVVSNGVTDQMRGSCAVPQPTSELSNGLQCFPEAQRSAHNTELDEACAFDSSSSAIGSRAQTSRGPSGVRDSTDGNVRFSRNLSVGRLRDRVLRRGSLSDSTYYPFGPEREESPIGFECALEPESALTSTSRHHCPPSSSVTPSFRRQDEEMESSRAREARYHNLLEHRSNFMERRRRIRSQRIGNRFENLPGHERSCILSGQHGNGQCSCRTRNRGSGNDDTSARASISRIVMLAEALFEVLDEIHQQSVVLSSRHSVSSRGSVPAPADVVESLPLKTFLKSRKSQNDDAAQCYICLVEYEEGDSMRLLPCNHEFHTRCVDKWLKEMHRICPLCRGDICRSPEV